MRPCHQIVMLNRFKNAVSSVMGGVSTLPQPGHREESPKEARVKFAYNRPEFLGLTAEEVMVSADHVTRPILVPRDLAILPWGAGYAEVINAGKTRLNEDQARAEQFLVMRPEMSSPSSVLGDLSASSTDSSSLHSPVMQVEAQMPVTYFGLFDGHAGTGAAIMAVNLLHLHIQEKLHAIHDLLLAKWCGVDSLSRQGVQPTVVSDHFKSVTLDSLVIGALEQAFCDMDKHIARDREKYRITGGCTALVALFFLGRLYVANAGDCRAVLCRGEDEVLQMSTDFTPHSERERIQYIASLQPELLHGEFCYLDFPKRLARKDVGKKTLYKDAMMRGWSCKTVTVEDTRFPLVYGEGKRARMLATIGVTRGFGDHDLMVSTSSIRIKPFLTPLPEVQVYDMSSYPHAEDDVLIMASDGLWDVTTNQQAADIIKSSLAQFPSHDVSRYSSAAQDLAMNARGLLKKGWKMRNDRPASGDDITVFVIPLHKYQQTASSRGSSTESSLENT